MVTRPQADEYTPYQNGYVSLVPDDVDIFDLLSGQIDELNVLMQTVSKERANVRPAPGEWSIKEVIGHLLDSERIFAYRAVRIARGDTTPLPGYDPEALVGGTDFNSQPLKDLIAQFTLQRQANVLCLKALTEPELARRSEVKGTLITVRAILYIIAGHTIHHFESLKTSYKVGA